MKNIAIIPSGGIGKRIQSPIPKQYVKVLGKEILTYTLETFQNSNLIDEIIIPAEKKYFKTIADIKKKYNITKITNIVEGGKERQDSVYNALISKNFNEEDYIIVHDAARPFLSIHLLNNAIKYAHNFDSVVVALKARDTIFSGNDYVQNYIDRSSLYYAQTPQIFKFKILIESFVKAKNQKFIATDESMIVKNAGFNVRILDGEFSNFKITTQNDIDLMQKFFRKK